MNRTRWTAETLLQDDDDDADVTGSGASSVDGTSVLPQPKEITRAALAAPDFDAAAFLAELAEFRTLRDVHEQIGTWERRLESELADIVNADFAEFVRAAESTAQGATALRAVSGDLARFSRSATRIEAGLDAGSTRIDAELAVHRALAREEARAHKLGHCLALAAELENCVPETEPAAGAALIVFARSFVAHRALARELEGVKAVAALAPTASLMGTELAEKLGQALTERENEALKLELAEALSYVEEYNDAVPRR